MVIQTSAFMPTFVLLSVCCSVSDNTGSSGITRCLLFPCFVDGVHDYVDSSRLWLPAACRKYIVYNINTGRMPQCKKKTKKG
jgi:hypothetical protein